jgi:hypothetical protein
MHQVAPVHAFPRKGSRVIARPQACVTDGHKHQEQRDNAHLLQPYWLPNHAAELHRESIASGGSAFLFLIFKTCEDSLHRGRMSTEGREASD